MLFNFVFNYMYIYMVIWFNVCLFELHYLFMQNPVKIKPNYLSGLNGRKNAMKKNLEYICIYLFYFIYLYVYIYVCVYIYIYIYI